MAEHTSAAAGSLLVRTLDSGARGFDAALAALTAFDASSDPAIESAVATIVDDVRRDGDRALVAYTRRFDRMTVRNAGALELTRAELAAAWKALGAIERRALQAAHTRIRDPARDPRTRSSSASTRVCAPSSATSQLKLSGRNSFSERAASAT